MELIYIGFVIFLFILAISDLWVGVSNDAVNFLNSAVGSKAARFRTVIIIAAIGVFCGAVMSNGMMDIARHGIFRPEQFSFSEVMFIFLAVMVSDIILLDTFNTLGMPTSTTVSMVFELLGASFAMTMFKMDSGTFSDYLNTAKALQVIIAIFVSVAIAFTVGTIVQWVSRLIFTFRYSRGLKWKIGIFGGIAATAIIYFMLLKGLKTMSFMTPELKAAIDTHTWLILLCSFVFFTLLMQLLHFCKVNVFKVIVLMGTFSLATAFAGNDLVNFIGVPLSGWSSFVDWRAAGTPDPSAFMMDSLNAPARTPFIFLLAAGVVMVISLATSRKAHNVTKTEINLAKQEEGEEMFGSSKVARSMVRWGNATARMILKVTPEGLRSWVDRRFDNSVVEIEDGAAYDLVRASVNLVTASLLIALGTSLKLPLSTTYVTFMVAMGSSMADRAWSRESAVYRITGVLSVVGGWLLTAGIAFVSAFVLALIMHFGGLTAAFILVAAGMAALIHSNLRYKKNKADTEAGDKEFRAIVNSSGTSDVWTMVSRYISLHESMEIGKIRDHYHNVTEGLMTENVRMLRRSYYDLIDEKEHLKNLRRKETVCMRKVDRETAMVKNAWFFSSLSEIEQLYYSIRRLSEPAYEHVDNNFRPLPLKYVKDFRPQRDELEEVLSKVGEMAAEREYGKMRSLEERIARLQTEFSDMRKSLMMDIQAKQLNINVAYLYLNFLQESEQMSITLARLIRSSRKFQLG